tara:strand:+ start:2932 stop:3174 length:243 start_codon:yes stop_codon:yes gene_type:complete
MMVESIEPWVQNGKVSLRVQPNASRTELIEENNQLKLYLKAQPEKGKANDALTKFFKKKYKLQVEVIKGKTAKNKILKII